MAIYSNKIINNDTDILSIHELTTMISSDELHIVFGETSFDYLLEFDVKFKGDDKRVVQIRNKYNDGVNSQPIPHEPSVKYIFGNHYKYDRMLGLPFEVDEHHDGSLKFQGKAANNWNLSDVDKIGKKIVKTMLKNDGETIYKYWYLNPKNPEEYEEMKKIENELVKKYAKERF